MNTLLKKYIYMPVTLFLMVLTITACSKEKKITNTGNDTTDVTLFVTRSGDVTNAPDKGEGIRTLRVIVATEEGIKVNHKFTATPTGTDPITQQSFTLNGLEQGKYDFYLIANEESLSTSVQETIAGMELDNILNDITGGTFPCPDDILINKGLPMTGKATNIEITNNNKALEIPLHYLVSKIVLNITNNTGKEIQLNSISFRHVARKTPLFLEETFLNVSGTYDDTNVSDTEIGATLTNNKITRTYYFYPTSINENEAGKTPLQIALYTNGKNYDYTDVQGKDGADMASIAPNQQVNIDGTISASGEMVLKCEVLEWETDGNESDVDYATELAYTAGEWSFNEIIDTDKGEVKIIKDNEGGNPLQFTIQTPIGATWSAELINPVGIDEKNTFKLSPSSGRVDGKPQTITVTTEAEHSISAELKITVRHNIKTWDVFLYKPDNNTNKNYILKLEI